jgi:hypothetical protein
MTFKKEYNETDIITVLKSFDTEVKSLTIKNKLAELDPKYEKVSKKWVTVGLAKLLGKGIVEKIKKPDEIADYWKLKE